MPTIGSLAALVDGRVVGDADHEIRDVANLESAGPEHISFLANQKYRAAFAETRAGAVLVPEGVSHDRAILVICPDPYLALARIASELHPPPPRTAGVEMGANVHPDATVDPTASVRVSAVVDAGARVGARTVIGPGCYVGRDACVGNDATLHPGAKVLDRCVLGDRVILQAGAVIGSDGFGYAPDGQNRRHKIPQVGIVEVGDDVEIGANTTVDRATFGKTLIGAGTKIDNLAQIAHNVATGRDCVIVAQSGIAGSSRLGDRVILGAQVGVAGHASLHDDVILAARTGVASDITDAGIYAGVPAIAHKRWLRVAVAQQNLPDMRRRLRELEKRLAALEANEE